MNDSKPLLHIEAEREINRQATLLAKPTERDILAKAWLYRDAIEARAITRAREIARLTFTMANGSAVSAGFDEFECRLNYRALARLNSREIRAIIAGLIKNPTWQCPTCDEPARGFGPLDEYVYGSTA